MTFRHALYIMLVILFSGCLGPVKEIYPEEKELRPVEVYVISHGWHVGIAVETSAVQQYLPVHEKWPAGRYMMFGWGDNRYYPADDPGTGLLLRAALLPTRSVIHVVGIDRPVEDYFPVSTVIRIMVSKKGAEGLAEFITGRFRLDQNGAIIEAADGLYRNSIFYEATGYYFIPKTSNTWTARALRKTGYPITPFYAVTSGNVVRQASKNGEVIQLR